MEPGHPILLDDGRVRLRVQKVQGKDVTCTVELGGLLKDHKGLNLPGALVSVPTITEKDAEDLAFGQEVGVDYVALSFVRTADDIRQARKLVAQREHAADREDREAPGGGEPGGDRRARRTASWWREETWAWRCRWRSCRPSRSAWCAR